MVSIDHTLGVIKTDARAMFDAGRVVELCRASGYWPEADGKLDPSTLVALFARQIAAGNVCCEQVRLMGSAARSAPRPTARRGPACASTELVEVRWK
jgi:hypothetical protein